MATSPGEQIGPHELVEQLGERSGVALFQARAHTTGRHPDEVAVRVAVDPNDGPARRAVAREHATLSLLGDPRIPQVLGHWQSRGAFAMTWLEGEDLSELMARSGSPGGALDAGSAVGITRQVAQALAHAHQVEGPDGLVVHEALGVDSVRVGMDGRVWLLGLGRHGEPGPHARPPEQAAEAFVDHRSDQWSLAAMLLHLVRGMPLPAASSSAQVQAALQPVHSRWPALGRVLQRALAVAAGDRFEDCGAFAAALAEAEAHLALPPTSLAALADRTRAVRNQEQAEREARLAAERAAREEAAALEAERAAEVERQRVEAAARIAQLEEEQRQAEEEQRRQVEAARAQQEAEWAAAEEAALAASQAAAREAEQQAAREAEQQAAREAEQRAVREAEQQAAREVERQAARRASTSSDDPRGTLIPDTASISSDPSVPDPSAVLQARGPRPFGARAKTEPVAVSAVAVEYTDSLDPTLAGPDPQVQPDDQPTGPLDPLDDADFEPTQIDVRGASISPLDMTQAMDMPQAVAELAEDGQDQEDEPELEPTEVVPNSLTGHLPDEDLEDHHLSEDGSPSLAPTEWAGIALSALFFVLGLTWLAVRIW